MLIRGIRWLYGVPLALPQMQLASSGPRIAVGRHLSMPIIGYSIVRNTEQKVIVSERKRYRDLGAGVDVYRRPLSTVLIGEDLCIWSCGNAVFASTNSTNSTFVRTPFASIDMFDQSDVHC